MVIRIFVFLSLGLATGLPILFGSDTAFLIGASFACTTVFFGPFLLSSARLLERPVWLLASLAVVVGMPVRAIGTASSDVWREFFYQDGLPSARSLAFVFGSCCVMAIGYVVGFSQRPTGTVASSFSHVRTSLRLGRFSPALLIGAISFVSVVVFISSTGGLDLSNLSAKRGIFSDLESGATSSSLIIVRSLNELPLTLVVLMIGAGATIGTDFFTRKVGGLVWVGLILVGLSVPFLSSQREVLVAFFALGGIVFLRRNGRISSRLLVGGLVVVLIFGVISEFRHSRSDDIGGLSASNIALESVDGLVRNRNLADLSKTVRIIEAVPDTFEVDNGARQFGSILGLIPRAVWPGKPVIGAGPEVSAVLYQNPVSGIPPGLIAESYWSFEWGGLLVLAVIGVLAGKIDGRISARRSAMDFAIGTLIFGPFLLDALGVGLGNAVIGTFIRAVQVWVCLKVLERFTPRRSSDVEVAPKPVHV